MLTGKELYELYQDALNEQGIGCDPWEVLTLSDQEAWIRMAGKVRRK